MDNFEYSSQRMERDEYRNKFRFADEDEQKRKAKTTLKLSRQANFTL